MRVHDRLGVGVSQCLPAFYAIVAGDLEYLGGPLLAEVAGYVYNFLRFCFLGFKYLHIVMWKFYC